MNDFAEIFQDGPPEKGSFLSRVFGIFNEEIIRIWARDSRSPYNIHEHRPTLYENKKRYTLDFLLEKNGDLFVSEMKCEIQYQNYRYWRLNSTRQLEHHRKKRAFELFLNISQDPSSVLVKAGEAVKIKGTVLVWGAATDQGVAEVTREFGISDVLTVESCIKDLSTWGNQEYESFLCAREQWLASLFTRLRGK
jgi:hypothetical protein